MICSAAVMLWIDASLSYSAKYQFDSFISVTLVFLSMNTLRERSLKK